MKLLLAVALAVITYHASLSQRNIAMFREITTTQAIGDKVYFSATHELYGTELFMSSGASESSTLVKDINPGNGNSSPSELTIFNNQLFFIAYSPDYGSSLWKTDGTAQGTQLVYGVKYGEPHGLMVFKGKLYFTTYLGSIMQSDGTSGGTHVHHQSAFTYGRIQNVIKDDQYLYYTDDARTIYRDNGTTRIKFLGPLSWEDVSFRNFFPLGDRLVVIKSGSYDNVVRIYTIDSNIVHDEGEDEWTLIKKLDVPQYGSQYMENFTVIGGKIFFNFRRHYDNVPPSDELWICDGTEAGTKMLKSFAWSAHTSNSHMGMFFNFHGKLFFRGGDAISNAIWTSDGSTQGTVKFHDTSIVAGYNDQRLPVLITENKFYFSGGDLYNAELWDSDGTTTGTKQLLDIDDAGSSWPHDFSFSNDILYFVTSKQFSATLWSTSPAPDISLWASPITPILSGTTPSLFYNVPKGSCQTSDLVIRNKGLSQLYLRSIYMTGRDFYIVKQPLPEVLAPGASVTIKIVFNAVVDGTSNGTLTILSNDRDEPRYLVNLKGNSTPSTASQVCQFPQHEYIRTLEPGNSASSIVLSNSSITEGQPIGTVIGQFSSAPGTTFALTAGEGDEDNDKFHIDGNQLISYAVFDYNLRTLYTLRVKATSAEGETESSFRIGVNNASAGFVSGECQPRFQQMGFAVSALESNAAGHLFATTTIGQVVRSTDAGKTWEIIYSGDYFDLPTITFKGNSGFIAGSNVLLKSDDGGATWFRLYVPGKYGDYYNAVAASFLNDKEGYVGNAAGEILFTKDGGHSWEVRLQDNYTKFRSLYFINKDKGFGIIEYGNLVQTLDGGRTWSPQDLSSLGWNTRAVHLSFTSDKKGFLITEYNLYKTANGGQSWTKIQDLSGTYSAGMKFFSETVGFLYGSEGVIYKTINGGDTWDAIYATGGRIVGVAQSSGQLFAATRSSYSNYETGRAISVSSDEGATWSNLFNYPGSGISRIQFYSTTEGVILTSDGLSRTKDNGITWLQGTTDITDVADILLVDETMAMIVSHGNIYKSTDAGMTTKLVLKTDTNKVHSPAGKLYAFPGNTLFSVGWDAMYRSDDLGETWTLISTVPGYYTQGMHFVSASTGYRMELFGSVEKTIDGGKTWTNIFMRDPTASNVFNAIFYLDESVGYKGGEFLQRTLDGGYTWETIKWPFYEIMAIHFENDDHGYVVTRGGQVHETTNGGATWETILSTSSRIADVQVRSGAIFLAGENGFSARMNTTPRIPSIPGYIYGEDLICAGDAIDFHVAVDSGYRTQWTTTGGNVEDQRDYITVRFPDPGEYTITARYMNVCGVSDVRSRTVSVSGPQSAPVIVGPSTATVGQQDIAYTVTDAVDRSSYLWSVEGGTFISSGDDGVLIDWTIDAENGKVNVLGVDAWGCRAYGSLVITLEVPLGIEDNLDEHVSLYPNPSEAQTRISSSYSGPLVVRIVDVVGREYSRYALGSGDEKNLETRNLSPGLYLVEISDGKQSVTKKLIKK